MIKSLSLSLLALVLTACDRDEPLSTTPSSETYSTGEEGESAPETCGGIPPLPPRVGGWQSCDPGEIGPQRDRLGCYVPTDATVGICTLICETTIDCSDLWVHQSTVPACDPSRQVCILPCLDGGCPGGMTCSQVHTRAICTWAE